MQNSKWTRILGLFLIVCVLTSSVGCIGGFGTYHKVNEFNRGVSDNKWIQELVFLVFTILPVYGIASFADILIFNTIEFWTGDNPMGHTDMSLGHSDGDM